MIFFKYLPHLYQGAESTGRRVLNMGGGGGGPSTSTTYTSNIPDWLRPQTEALLGAATQEYFQTEFDPTTGGYNIVGTKPYTPYSSDPRDYFADFSPQQQQVFAEAAGMQTPEGFEQGAGLTASSAIRAMTPMSYQPYMSPYMQDVVDIQKRAAIEDAQKAQLGTNLGAARSGTYGGARQLLAQTQREAALQQGLSDIQAKGLQSAYDQARQAQQFGITTGMQAGSQLANIAAGQQQADLARLGFQGQMGDIQQQQQQAIINQAIQDYALSQEMPMQRLAGYNALLRGYATPTTTVSQYGAAANPLQTIGALGTAASGFGSLAGKKEGGVIKYAKGGITDTDAIESFAEDLSIPQLQQSMRSGELKNKEYIGMPILQNKVVDAERMKMAQAMMSSQQGQQESISDALMAKANQLQGAQSVMAGGGIVAFEAGGLVTPRQLQEVMNRVNSATSPAQKQAAQAEYDSLLAAYRMQQSASSDTGAGVGIKPMGGIMPAPAPNVKSSQGVTAKPPTPTPTPEPQQGITEVVPPELTREQEVNQYLEDRKKLVGESSLAKFYADQAAEERPFLDRLSSASAKIGLAGSMLQDPSRTAEYAMQADALGRAEAERIYKQKEAAAKAEEVAREEKGKGFDVVEGRREDRAKEKRTEAREIAREKRSEQVKERLTRLEASLRRDPDAFNRELYKNLNSEDPAVRAGAEKWFASKQPTSLAAYSNLKPTDVLKEWNKIQDNYMQKKQYAEMGITTLEQYVEFAEKSLLAKKQGTPKSGTVIDGYRFKGGDPGDEKNWEKV